MAYIPLYNIFFTPPPTGVTTVSVSYKLASDPDVIGSYTVYTTTLAVNSDGSLIGGTPFYINGLLENTAYTVKISTACGDFKDNTTTLPGTDGTTTTTTSTSTTSTSSTTTTTTTLTPTTTTSTSTTSTTTLSTTSTSSTTTTSTTGNPATSTTSTSTSSTSTTSTSSTTTTTTTPVPQCPTLIADDNAFYITPKSGDSSHGYYRIFTVTPSPAYNPSMGLQELPVTAWFRKASDPDVSGSYTLIGTGSYYYSYGEFSFPVWIDSDLMIPGESYVFKIKLDCDSAYYLSAPFSHGSAVTNLSVINSGGDASITNLKINSTTQAYTTGGYPIPPGAARGAVLGLTGDYPLSITITGFTFGSSVPQKINIIDSFGNLYCENLTSATVYTFPSISINSTAAVYVTVEVGNC